MTLSRPSTRFFYLLLSAAILSTLLFFLVFNDHGHASTYFHPSEPLAVEAPAASNAQTKVVEELDTPPVAPSEPAFCNYCSPTDELCKRYGSFNLARSRAYEGPNARLKRILRKAQTPSPLKIGIIGGSVSKGLGVTPETNWSTLYAQYLRETFGVEVELINGSVGATVSEYMETCFLEHIPEDVDLVVIELGINDRRFESLAMSYENLIRAVLALPKKPAIINLQIMALMFDSITMGGDLHTAIAQYYDTPIVSIRNVLLPHILQTTEANSTDTSLENYWYHHDANGIDLRHLGTNGHRMLADLLQSFTSRVACEAWREDRSAWNWSPEQDESGFVSPIDHSVAEYLPRQSLFQKYDHTTILQPAKPFCQVAGGTKHPLQPLPPPLSTSPGEGEKALDFALWSHPSRPDKIWLTGRKPGAKVAFKVFASTLGRVRITYLRSKTYGLGSAFCWVDDRREDGRRMDGWWEVENMHSPNTRIIGEPVTPGEHILHCEILKETKDPGGGTEFRIIAVDAL